ncbi:MAG: acyltransferase [Prevotella sp.]|nr:acyltransferase [Candidatus Prevotella equi]
MKNRIVYLDRIKGFAILLMVLAHVYMLPLQMGDSFVFNIIGSFHMYLFMFISGFVAFIPASKFNGGGIFGKWKKRFFGYICPAMMVGWMFALFGFIILDKDVNFSSFIGGAWYLKCMAIFCCIQFITIKLKHVWQELLVCAVCYGLFMFGWKHNDFLNQLMVLEHCTCFFPFYVLGYYARRYDILEYIKDKNWIYTIAIIGYLCLFFGNIENHLLMNICDRFIRPTLAIIAIVYLFMQREGQNSKVEKWLSNIGKQTLDIYIYHGFFILGTLQLNLQYLKDWTVSTNNHVLCLIIATIVSVLLAYISIFIGKFVRTSDIVRKLVYGQFWER